MARVPLYKPMMIKVHEHCWHETGDAIQKLMVGMQPELIEVCCYCKAHRMKQKKFIGHISGHGPHAPSKDTAIYKWEYTYNGDEPQCIQREVEYTGLGSNNGMGY